ncbi:MAG: iron ABC transporter substrate-binding protein [Spirochaetales bacterium]|nr:iron ABC transporter substrate-binding protein [Spirochaetales bacterium]
MKRKIVSTIFLVMLGTLCCHAAGSVEGENDPRTIESGRQITVVDASGREISVPLDPGHVICSGAGSLRLLTYLQAQDRAVAVDDMEGRRPRFDARPYSLANPQFAALPLFGEFRGHDNPELIAALDPQPQVIFKTFSSTGTDPLELERQTGIPVVVLDYGDLSSYREQFYTALRTMAAIMARGERAEELIAFFETTIADLDGRTADIPQEEKKSCYIGGIAYRGPHGFQSTEPTYPPFMFVNADNVAWAPGGSLAELEHADVAKEQLVFWDPDVLFVDVSTLQSDPRASAVYELQSDPAYTELTAVRTGEVYGVLPYNWYTVNFGSILADSYFVGQVLYPERFRDIEPAAKADEIYEFLVGAAVFQRMNRAFQGLVFTRIPL